MSEKCFNPRPAFCAYIQTATRRRPNIFWDVRGGCFCVRISWRGKLKKTLFSGLAAVLTAVSSLAAPPHPDLEARLKQERRWDEFVLQFKSWKEKLGYPNQNPYRAKFSFSGKVSAALPVPPDTLKVVVIYAAPSDRPPSADGLAVTRDQLQAILFGPNATGSMTDFFKQVSYGQTVVVGTVFGPYTLPQTNQYYTSNAYGMGSYPNNAQKFVVDAVTLADGDIDFSQFDYNNNGAVDGLFVIHSGPGGEYTGQRSDIWSHAYVAPILPRDGKILGHYSIEPEQQPGPIPIQIGVFCHEAGHALFGLPDLYDTDYSSSGLGVWCLMSAGNYQNNSKTPAHMSAWCKKEVGWLSPVNLTANQASVFLPTVQFEPAVYRLWTHGNGGMEYFLVENRSRRGFDSFLPAGGLLIWHIDEAVTNNNGESRYMVALEQADGLKHLENGIGRGDAGDVFPGSTNKRTFNESSNPNSLNNTLQLTQVAVTNISNADSVMTADLQVTYPQPYIALSREGAIFNAIYKGAPPAGLSMTVTNDGGGSLNWRADWNRASAWLAVTPDSGTAPTTAYVGIASTNVLPGSYTDTVLLTSPAALNAPQKVWVNYEVTSVRGDLTRDGLLSAADIITLLSCLFTDGTGPNCELLVADTSCDGLLSALDIVVLLQMRFNSRPPC